jgi:pimeloyl-ACP methyl ester carboxylesterase
MSEGVTSLVRDGLRLHVEDSGDGMPVVLQHGLCGDAAQPAELFPADSGLRRITLECRGHGRSEAGDPEQFAIATFSDDVAALIETTGEAPVVLGGVSMGAAIALRLAVHRPELVGGLVLVRPAWVTAVGPDNMAPNAEVGGLLATLPAEEAKARFLASDTARRLGVEAPDNLASLTSFFSRADPKTTAALLERISADGPGVSKEQLRALRIPTLIVGHGRDTIHPFAHAERLSELIPHARLVRVTPKTDDRDRYVADIRAALAAFLKDF